MAFYFRFLNWIFWSIQKTYLIYLCTMKLNNCQQIAFKSFSDILMSPYYCHVATETEIRNKNAVT